MPSTGDRMLDALYNESVTLRRPKAGTLRGSGYATMEQLLDATEAAVRIQCLLQARRRRTVNAAGSTLDVDAQLLYRVVNGIDAREGDFIVRADGTAWEVVGGETQRMLAGSALYGRADLKRTEIYAPPDKHGS